MLSLNEQFQVYLALYPQMVGARTGVGPRNQDALDHALGVGESFFVALHAKVGRAQILETTSILKARAVFASRKVAARYFRDVLRLKRLVKDATQSVGALSCGSARQNEGKTDVDMEEAIMDVQMPEEAVDEEARVLGEDVEMGEATTPQIGQLITLGAHHLRLEVR